MRWVLVLLVVVAAASPVSAQTSKPKPRPEQRSSSGPTAAGTLAISTDDDCTLAVDGRSVGTLRAGDVTTVPVAIGKHIVHAVSIRAASASWDGTAELKKDTGQEIVAVALKARVEQALKTDARRSPVHGGDGVIGTRPVALLVDGALQPFARPHAEALAAVGIRLVSRDAPAGPNAPADGVTVVYAELAEQGSQPGAATEIKPSDAQASGTVQSCSVAVGLSLWQAQEPRTWSFEDTGAATRPGEACNVARRKAVTSALSTLVNVVRKERQ